MGDVTNLERLGVSIRGKLGVPNKVPIIGISYNSWYRQILSTVYARIMVLMKACKAERLAISRATIDVSAFGYPEMIAHIFSVLTSDFYRLSR